MKATGIVRRIDETTIIRPSEISFFKNKQFFSAKND